MADIAKVLLDLRRRLRNRRVDQQLKDYDGLSLGDVFTKIYTDRAWGLSSDPTQRYCSGGGSRDEEITGPYIEAVIRFLNSLGSKPDVVDLGCGDFNVGSKLRPHCNAYTACDIVLPLIEENKTRYQGQMVDFRVLDITSEDAPPADVVFIRQVLQHLSNDAILRILPRLAKYRYLVLTEHLPLSGDFPPNLDKPAGPDTRMRYGSGIVITSPPFNLQALERVRICEVRQKKGLIATDVLKLS